MAHYEVNVEYSKERNSWNVFVNGEWYFEGNYEQANDVANSFLCPDEDELNPGYEEY